MDMSQSVTVYAIICCPSLNALCRWYVYLKLLQDWQRYSPMLLLGVTRFRPGDAFVSQDSQNVKIVQASSYGVSCRSGTDHSHCVPMTVGMNV